MSAPADPPGPAEGALHEPFYDHRVPPYACPARATGVLLLKPDTLHIGEAAESRALADAVGPQIGVGQRRFVCLFECCDASCRETVACIGEMSGTRDPLLPWVPDPVTPWEPESGLFPDVAEQRRREQAELVHEYQPRQFLPAVDAQARCVPCGSPPLDRHHPVGLRTAKGRLRPSDLAQLIGASLPSRSLGLAPPFRFDPQAGGAW